MTEALNQSTRTVGGARTFVLHKIEAAKRVLGLKRSHPEFETMSDEELEAWRQNFLLRINTELAWRNYLRSDEAKAISRRYDRVTMGASYSIFVSLSAVLVALGFDLSHIGTMLFLIGTVVAASIPVHRLARSRYSYKPFRYAIENYWPTDDGDPRTDISAVPETVMDRFGQGLYVLFWLFLILQGWFTLLFVLQHQ